MVSYEIFGMNESEVFFHFFHFLSFLSFKCKMTLDGFFSPDGQISP